MNRENYAPSSERLESVDALRGFALFAIVLLHNLEHYNIFGSPADAPAWLQQLDGWLYDTTFFLLAGKAYAIFSLLFGFSFFIQMRNARRRGCDFRVRFAWRMVLLFAFSQLHALFYNGDILLLYAVCGLVLIPASSWSDRTVLIVASLLMLQPFAWGKIVYALIHPDYIDTNSMFMQFGASATEVGRTGNLWQTLANNIWTGQLYSNFWQVEAGRLFQTPALFLLGMWLARCNAFERSAANVAFWRNALVVSLVAMVPLFLLSHFVPQRIEQVTVRAYYGVAVPMVYNFAFMVVWVALFFLLWYRAGNGQGWQRVLVPYGRMSLTNYIGQSIIGVSIYYHFGLSMYDKVGATLTLLIGCAIFALQLVFSRYWLARHRQGPLEYVWKRGTWIKSNR